ncbi:MAG: hypothetical protein HY645_02470 [Acidobacteria bacterium]|nr:hypothetical protein [Acidobacteriota bacterium]
MPLYEFACRDCGYEFQEIFTVPEFENREKNGFTCPKCQSRNVEELISVHVHTAKKS